MAGRYAYKCGHNHQLSTIEMSMEHKDEDLAISYVIQGSYPNEDLSNYKDKRRAIRKRAKSLQVQNGEVFILKKGKKLRAVTSLAEHCR